jgi:hypothetical protein
LLALMQTPHRFRTKRQLWTYSGLGLETHDSAQYRLVEGQLKRSPKSVTLRGLNPDYNRDLKDIFKGASTRVSSSNGPLRDFYENLLAQGEEAHDGAPDPGEEDCRDHLDRLEEGGRFRRQLFEITSRLSASGRDSVPLPGDHSWRRPSGS